MSLAQCEVSTLVQAGADLELATVLGDTPLMGTARFGYPHTVQVGSAFFPGGSEGALYIIFSATDRSWGWAGVSVWGARVCSALGSLLRTLQNCQNSPGGWSWPDSWGSWWQQRSAVVEMAQQKSYDKADKEMDWKLEWFTVTNNHLRFVIKLNYFIVFVRIFIN